jgi:hypothetical protein
MHAPFGANGVPERFSQTPATTQEAIGNQRYEAVEGRAEFRLGES